MIYFCIKTHADWSTVRSRVGECAVVMRYQLERRYGKRTC